MNRSAVFLLLLSALGSVAEHTQMRASPQAISPAGLSEVRLPPLANEPLDESKRADIDALLTRHHRPDAPGCAVGVYRRGAILYSSAFGVADLSSGELLTPDTAINIGSVAKQFTAAAVLLLAQEGKLSLDENIRTYMPELPDYGAPITLRQLLTHTSGIRDYRGLLNLAGHSNNEQVPATRILALMARQQGLNFPPGDQYQYSNGGYFLAALIVERIAREPFSKFTRRRIFEPLGMARAAFKGDTASLWPVAVHYEFTADGRFEPFAEHWEEVGGGDLYTTIENLARWDGNFYSGKVGGQQLVRALQTAGVLANGRRLKYALGLEHGTLGGHRSIGHGGASGGSISTLRRFPDARLSIAVVCNRADGPADGMANDIAALLLPSSPAAGTSTTVGPDAGRPNAPPTTWVGSYRAPGNANLVGVHIEGDGLVMKLGGGRFALRPMGGDVYKVIGAPMDIFGRFEPANGNRPRRLVPVDSDDPPMEAFEPVTPTAAELAAYAGDYQCPEIEANILIRVAEGKLLASLPLETTESLRPLERGTFTGADLVFTFDKAIGEKRSPGFRLDQWRARGMRCERGLQGKPSP